MSRNSRLIPFIVEMTLDKGISTPIEWHKTQSPLDKRMGRPADGKPTAENLKKWAEFCEKATYPGGVNQHLGVTHIMTARIKDQRTGEILATFTRDPVPMFEVI
jgi:hypothetical protein